MTDSVKNLLDGYIIELQNIYGRYLQSVILYGSYARGDFTKESDVDIKPIAKSREHFMKWVDNYPFYANVNREGVKLFEAA